MATFTQIQDRVKRRVIDLPASVTTEVPALINEAMRRLQRKHNFKVMETETAILTTTIALRTLSTAAVPSNFKEMRGSPYLITESGGFKDLLHPDQRASAMREYSVSDVNAEGEPRLIVDGEPSDLNVRNWAVYPFPDGNSDFANGEYRIVIPYWRYLPILVINSDANWFTADAEEYLVYRATAEAFALNWDEERMAIWTQKAADERVEVIKTDKKTRLAGVDTLVPHLDVHGSRLRS